MSEGFVPDTTRHVYRKKIWVKVACLVGGVGSLVFGAIILMQIQFLAASPGAIAVVAAVFVLDALLIVSYGIRSGVVMEGTRITVSGALRTRRADVSEIEGYRNIRGRSGVTQRIFLKGGRGTILLETDLATDDYFHAWFTQIPELGPRR